MNSLDKLIALEQEAAHFGFKWEDATQIMQQIQSECAEVQAHLKDLASSETTEKLQEEIGDLLHAVFSLSIFCQLDPQVTLEKAIAKFARRFALVKQLAQAAGLFTLEGQSFQGLMHFWQ